MQNEKDVFDVIKGFNAKEIKAITEHYSGQNEDVRKIDDGVYEIKNEEGEWEEITAEEIASEFFETYTLEELEEIFKDAKGVE